RTIAQTGFSDGTLMGAIGLVSGHMADCSYENILTRMTAAAQEASDCGVRTLRTHIDALRPLPSVPAWRAAQKVRDAMAPHMTVQIATLCALARARESGFEQQCAQVAKAGGILGAFVPPGPADPDLFDIFLAAAARHGLDVDFHIDEGLDPTVCNTATLAKSILRVGFEGNVVAGHCCALAALPATQCDAALDLIAASGLAVVSLPQTNLFLQDRKTGSTPRHRGLTLIHELRARGVPVAIGTDNVGDAFFPFGDYDLLALLAGQVAAGQLDSDLGGWMQAITDVPARALGITDTGRIAPDQRADLMLLPAQNWTEILATKPDQRYIIRDGHCDHAFPLSLSHPIQSGAAR
ncbi:MAG: amidohydrolase family protein, partial [Sulfitobacter sp.]